MPATTDNGDGAMPEPEAGDDAVETVKEDAKPEEKLRDEGKRAIAAERAKRADLEKKLKEYEEERKATMDLPDRLRASESEREALARQLKVRDIVDSQVSKLAGKYSIDRGKVSRYAEKFAKVAESDTELEDEIAVIVEDLRVPVTVKTLPTPAPRSDSQPDPLAGKQPGELTHAELIAISKQDMGLYNTIMNTRRSALSKTK